MSIFDKLRKQVNMEEINKQVKENLNNTGAFKELPVGKYYAKVTGIELTESKAGDPMLKTQFEILDGEYKKWKHTVFNVFKASNLDRAISNAVTLLTSLGTGIEVLTIDDIEAEIDNIFDEVETQGLEYEIEIGEGKTGFKYTNIIEVFQD